MLFFILEWETYDANDRNQVPEEKVVEFVSRLITKAPQNQRDFDDAQRSLRKELKIAVSKSQMLAVYEKLVSQMTTTTPTHPSIEQFLVKKVVRTHSGNSHFYLFIVLALP